MNGSRWLNRFQIRKQVGALVTASALLLWLASAAASAVVVDEQPSQRVGPLLDTLLDPTGEMNLADIRQADEFVQRATDSGFGFHPGRLWLRFNILNPGSSLIARWLSVEWSLQEEETLHLVRADGSVSTFRNGSLVPIEERAVQSRAVLFPIELAPGEEVTAYLVLSGDALSVFNLQLWSPARYMDRVQRLAALKYLGVGTTLMLVFFCILAAKVRKEPELLFAAVAQVLALVYMLVRDGYAAQLLPVDDQHWQQRAMQISFGLLSACHLRFANVFLGPLEPFPHARRILNVTAISSLMIALVALFVSIPWLSIWAAVVTIGLLTIAALANAIRGDSGGRAYLAAWGLMWCVVMLRIGQGLGWLHLHPSLMHLPVWALTFASIPMSYALYHQVIDLERATMKAQRSLLKARLNETRRLKQAVAERTQQLLEATTLAEETSHEKSRFLSMMAHELHSPLHQILGYTLLLKRGVSQSHIAWLELIERNGRKLLLLLDQALSYSRGEAVVIELDPGPVNLVHMLEELVRNTRLAERLGAGRLSLVVLGQLPDSVEVDEQRLQQVLENLLGNAFKYGNEGAVELGVQAIDSTTVPGGEDGADGRLHQLRFWVRDSGPGIELAHQTKIFEAFSRLSPARAKHGMGLGLYICRQLLQAMGSDIQLKSEPGKGSCFFFVLELVELAADAVLVPPSDALAPLSQMLELGQIVTIETWLQATGEQHPEWRDFLNLAEERCRLVDLPGLRRVLARAGLY
jgi:signal transduction histidine kinase